MPFDSGLRTGVKHGTRPRAAAKSSVSLAVKGLPLSDSHSTACGAWIAAKRSSTASSIRSRTIEPAHQHDGAVLHHRQEGILLRAVEAMDLVDEEQRPLPGFAPRARRVEYLLEIGDTGKNRRNLLEMQVGGLRQQPRHGSLAGAGRPPEHQRAQRAGVEQARERAVGTEEMILAHDLAQAGRPQLVGERTRCVALEPRRREQARSPALGARRRHPRSSTDTCWPPRRMVMLQRRLAWPATRSRSRVLAIFALLTDTTRSPRWKPSRCADEPLTTSSITTPWVEGSSRRSSASAGERFDTLAPWNGEGEAMTSSSCAVSGRASSGTVKASSRPARRTPMRALPPITLVAKR